MIRAAALVPLSCREIKRASAYVSRATCWTQALEAQVLLERHGYPTVMHLRVTRADEPQDGFFAHAWRESNGSVVVGASDVPHVPLATLRNGPGITMRGHDPHFWRAAAKRRAI